ncbi:hypothetical protein F7725_013144 [Dissostichus mawsoni]|uniref:Ribosomal protein eL8/eL30/eS12/Gadd45 domain-containing protein n=1 Tax=Dissostichus mawsoni TaxID=36200 RepID=A0A7J5YPA0_DISMA|nr:hypothetical protein F7725_013144 [Dissostichus mawsoni]
MSSAALQSPDLRQQWRQRKDPAEPHTASSPPVMLPNPYVSEQSLRGNWSSGQSQKQNPSNTNGATAEGKVVGVSRSHGYSSSRRVKDTREDVLQRERSTQDAQAKTSKGNIGFPAQADFWARTHWKPRKKVHGITHGFVELFLDNCFRSARSAPNSEGKSKPAKEDLAPFEVKMTDFPELAGGPMGKPGPPIASREGWGLTPPPTLSPQTQTSASSWKSARKESPTQTDPRKMYTNAKPDSQLHQQVTSWANVASQPPKKPVPKEKTINSDHMQTEEMTAQQEEGAPGKKKRKKKKKKSKGAGEEAEAEAEEPAMYQAPPKFEDEEEFPGLTPALTGADRLTTSSYAAKLCNEENQREIVQHQSADQTKEKSAAGKSQPTETSKKGQLDIGNMLAALEKKQSQKVKQDAKPLVLSVGGGLPVVQKQPLVQKKPPWQQDKIAHNPLDSTSPLVKKGKQREVPKAKKPTPLKKVILKEREERKQKRLLEERGLLPENELKPTMMQKKKSSELRSPTPTEELEDQSEMNCTSQMVKEGDEEEDKEEIVEQQPISPVPCQPSRPKIHSRKFRDYCNQMLSKTVDECVTTLLKELVRFQDRLYQKDPMKARMKRRIVMGLREVLKHLKLRKVKCVVISPNCERIQSKGGLDEALYTIIDTCREQGVPFVFALSRKALGRCVNKAVPVSLVGIFNYDGAQDFYHKMIELSSEARKAYETMVSSLEQTGQEEAEEAGNNEEELQISSPAEEAEPSPDPTQPEEPEYMKIWKKMLEKDCNHTFLNFEEQLSSKRLDSECTENTEEDEKS